MLRIDIEACEHCDGAVQIIASIDDPLVIAKILDHLRQHGVARDAAQRDRNGRTRLWTTTSCDLFAG